MRAVLCKQWGPPESLVVENLPDLSAGPDEVVVSVKACGVAFPDVLTIQGKYQIKPAFPFSPGNEIAGIVSSVGSNITATQPGDAVLGRGKTGGCAEEVIATPENLWPLPAGVDFTVAAGFGMNYATSYHALRDRGQLKAGETLMVLGASGGVGLAAVELGKMMGARVIACASTEEKLETCRRFGADEVINYETGNLRDAVKQLTGDKGVDVIYDPVGDRFADPAVRCMAWGGRYLVVGFAAGAIPKIPLNLALLKGCSIVGVWWGGLTKADPKRANAVFAELLAMVASGKIKPYISATYPLERTGDALKDLMTRKVQGKIVVVTGR